MNWHWIIGSSAPNSKNSWENPIKHRMGIEQILIACVCSTRRYIGYELIISSHIILLDVTNDPCPGKLFPTPNVKVVYSNHLIHRCYSITESGSPVLWPSHSLNVKTLDQPLSSCARRKFTCWELHLGHAGDIILHHMNTKVFIQETNYLLRLHLRCVNRTCMCWN